MMADFPHKLDRHRYDARPCPRCGTPSITDRWCARCGQSWTGHDEMAAAMKPPARPVNRRRLRAESEERLMNYEDAARRRKALAIADFCRYEDIPAVEVVMLDEIARRDLCERAGVNEASDKTWAVVVGLLGAVGEHETFVTAGGLSNFTVTCICGKTWGVASFSQDVAERSADEHVHAFDAERDPFANL